MPRSTLQSAVIRQQRLLTEPELDLQSDDLGVDDGKVFGIILDLNGNYFCISFDFS